MGFCCNRGLKLGTSGGGVYRQRNRDEIKFNDFLHLSARLHHELTQNVQIKLIKNAADLAAIGEGQGVIFSLEGR